MDDDLKEAIEHALFLVCGTRGLPPNGPELFAEELADNGFTIIHSETFATLLRGLVSQQNLETEWNNLRIKLQNVKAIVERYTT